jgi:tetratricopeptide (TPR) repeat protein
VELANAMRPGDTHRADVRMDGNFQLSDVASGEYILRVLTLGGEVLHQEPVTVRPNSGILTVRLPGLAKPSTAPGTISMTQLRHPPARKAFQAVVSAQRFAASGKTEKAIEELEKAIRISPEYADAYNKLAVQHLRMERFEEAASELARSIAIAGPSATELSNLAYAESRLHRLKDAAASARAALHLDSGFAKAHLILGLILANDPGARTESIQHLERAAETLPSAREALDRLHAR